MRCFALLFVATVITHAAVIAGTAAHGPAPASKQTSYGFAAAAPSGAPVAFREGLRGFPTPAAQAGFRCALSGTGLPSAPSWWAERIAPGSQTLRLLCVTSGRTGRAPPL